MTNEYDYHKNRKPFRTYISPRIAPDVRIAHKVMDSSEAIVEAVEAGKLVLRTTRGGRQEIIAKFYESERHHKIVTIRKWNTEKGRPAGEVYFTFRDDEIPRLLGFLANIVNVRFDGAKGLNINDDGLQAVLLKKQDAETILSGETDLELVARIAESQITEREIVALGYRRKQLEHFDRLLRDRAYFDQLAYKKTPEAVWQAFFEANSWIFGHGLSYIFMDPLDGRKLEQTVRGFSLAGSGKRVDSIMKTRAFVSSLCFIELKTHYTPLIEKSQYRPGVWAPSRDVSGGVAQAHEAVRASLQTLTSKFQPNDSDGNPTGEQLWQFEPRSYLIVGQLSQFLAEHGINEDQFRSFEIFRRNVRQPEIVTYDELFFRAKFIVDSDAMMIDK